MLKIISLAKGKRGCVRQVSSASVLIAGSRVSCEAWGIIEIAQSFFTEVIMNTKLLMTSSSLVLGLAGIFALFAPDVLLAALSAPMANPLSVLIQLMGALYFSMAMMNWTAKDSVIGGIYARPVSIANFAHFFIGTLLLTRVVLSSGFNLSITLLLVVYAIFVILFYWLVFRARGIKGG